MSLLNLVSYESEPEDEANSLESGRESNQIVNEEHTLNQVTVLRPDDDTDPILTVSANTSPIDETFAGCSRLTELPQSSLEDPNPATLQTIKQYLELKEISGFDLTEVSRDCIFLIVHEYQPRI
jgi:hypothetical protein